MGFSDGVMADGMEIQVDFKTLPLDIKDRITDLLECEKNADFLHHDIYWCELYGSINSSQHGREISKQMADFLREKYLGI